MQDSSKKKFKGRFFNTVEPVAPLYHDLIPYWTHLGWQVETIISRAEYREEAGNNKAKSWQQKGVMVRRTPSFGCRLRSPNKLAKPLIMIGYMLWATILSLFGPKVDKNFFLTQPPLFFVWGWVLQKFRKQPYFIISMDMYPDVAICAGVLKKDSFLARILTRMSRFGLRRADGIIVIGRCMEQRMLEAGVKKDRIHLIPNWTNTAEIRPIPHQDNSYRTAKGWQQRFVILYSGNIGVSHYFDDILEVAGRLIHQCPSLLFVFTGYGQRRQELERAKEQYQLDNIELLPFQARETLGLSLGAGDVHFVSLRDGFEGLVVPSKAYGVLAAGRPLIYQGNRNGEIARMIIDEDIGIVVPLHDADSLQRAILTYMENPDLVVRQGKRARKLSEKDYSTRTACEKYTQLVGERQHH